jgi:hypothetical protein
MVSVPVIEVDFQPATTKGKDMINRLRWVAAAISTIMLGFTAFDASADEEADHHEYPHHHAALFVGYGIERDKKGHEENASAYGLEYEIQLSNKWGVGFDYEKLSTSDAHRSWVAVVPISYHLSEKWRLFAGPGKESGDKEDRLLARFGVAYEIPFHERWTASPEVLVDFIEGGATTFVIGVAIGYGF